MIKRPFSHTLLVSLGIAASAGSLTTACSNESPSAATATDESNDFHSTGRLEVALTAQGASGALYRLRNADLSIVGLGGGPSPEPQVPIGTGEMTPVYPLDNDADVAVGPGSMVPVTVEPDPTVPVGPAFSAILSTEQDPLGRTLEATLPPGAFESFLFGDFFLERILDGEPERVESRLLGSPFQLFEIEANEETAIVYRFETTGEVINFGEGRLTVEIGVEEKPPPYSPTASCPYPWTPLDAQSPCPPGANCFDDSDSLRCAALQYTIVACEAAGGEALSDPGDGSLFETGCLGSRALGIIDGIAEGWIEGGLCCKEPIDS